LNEAKGHVSIVEAPQNVVGVYLWANGIDWNTEDASTLDGAEKWLVESFAPILGLITSFPSDHIETRQDIWIYLDWSGDARLCLEKLGDQAGEWAWSVPKDANRQGAPTEFFLDNYAIPVGSRNPFAAHLWMNYILDPGVAAQDMSYHGYNPGIKSITSSSVGDLVRKDMIFFDETSRAAMTSARDTSTYARRVEIFERVRSRAKA
jgi:spermidine/putrescine transport system substrate-binding protein